MKSTLLVGFVAFALVAVTALSPAVGARPSPACVKVTYSTPCDGIVCVDRNLNGWFEYHECVRMYCPGGCCDAPCPPPDH